MPDAAIKPGDVCHDLVQRGKVQVVELAAQSVSIHRQRSDYDITEYKANALLDVQETERVFTCVYLPEDPTVSFSGTYDFPESRLARVPVEEANDGLDRVQHTIATAMLERLFNVARREENTPTADAVADLALAGDIPEALVETALELADVEDRFAEVDIDE